MAPLGLTADSDLSLLLALTDVPIGRNCCPTCITGHLTRPDLVWGDHATSAPFQVCEDCDSEIPDEYVPERGI